MKSKLRLWHNKLRQGLWSKHSQLEIMGLVVVVILISLALLFVIQFMALRPSVTPKEVFTQEQMASSMISAFALTTTECQGLDVTELLQDCGGFKEVSCGTANQKNSCEFVRALADELFGKTLRLWRKQYSYVVSSGDVTLLNLTNGGCSGTKDTTIYPIPSKTGGNKIFMRLEVCGTVGGFS